jgi:MFS family permease
MSMDCKKWLVVVAVDVAMALAALDNTVVGTAMPTVVASLGGLRLFSWVFSIYLLTSTAALPIFGRLSDLFGLCAVALGVPVSLMVPDLSPIQQLARAEAGAMPSAAPPGEFS